MNPFHETATASHQMSRRHVLRGLGTMMSLPFLESFGGRALAATAAKAPAKAPLRAAWLYIPNGVNVKDWFPTGEGKNYELSATLKEIERHRNDFMVVSGLAQDKARSHGNGGGDHARATSTFLTGCMPKKTAGSDIQLGVSVDQIAAQKIGHLTRLPSLELSTDGQRSSGRCDSGYSCAYQFNLAWKNETMPMAPEMDPRLVFERLFGYGASGARGADGARRQRLQKSILDTVLAEAKSLQNKVSGNDRRKLDEYYSSVRDIELRIERAEKFTSTLPKDYPVPEGIPESYEEHIHMMFDLLALAFQTDTTRLCTFMLAHDGSNRSFPQIGVPDAHHYLSHHENDEQKLEKIAKIDRFYMRQFGYFLDKLKSIKEGEGNLLDNSMIVFGGGIGDGNRHNHDNLPILLAGHASGTWTPGRRVVLPGETPMTNLYLSMLDRLGVRAERVGDSTGVLDVS
ncbi:Protein of unknown function [Prosthecobacter debontii]|uniref:DUF1552 domain-containing protein n=1 Tax=Prosthecobacter debontii TaxID=48467 RepID=A0A1T4XH22_9BACT|nr:DUF1552 domain-containing protein [Prosthecobacter debontii]SKA88381.1 Protein of unknown function [Prosthecobacter debontii]